MNEVGYAVCPIVRRYIYSLQKLCIVVLYGKSLNKDAQVLYAREFLNDLFESLRYVSVTTGSYMIDTLYLDKCNLIMSEY